MALQIIKATNIGLQCGTVTIPCIKFVLSGDSGTLSPEFNAQLLTFARGFTTTIGYLVNSYREQNLIPTELQTWGSTNITLGTNTGFKLTFVSSNNSSYSRCTDKFVIELFFNNSKIYSGTIFLTPTANQVRINPLCIFVDENNKLYSVAWSGTTQPPFSLRYPNSDDLGCAKVNDILVANISPNFNEAGYNSVTITLTKTENDISDYIKNEIDPTVTDPYAPGGTSGVAGGGGSYDFTGDTIEDDPLPSLSAVDTGFITLFKPTVQELNGLAGFMWNDLDVNNFTRIFNDIMDVILGLSLVPLSPNQIPSAGRRSVTLGNIVATDITCEACSDQWVRIPAGELTLQETFAGYLDYDPFTEAQIYLPFIGYRSLRVDDIMEHTLTLSYDFDILSGGCVAKLFVDGSIMYQFIGEAAVSIPITGGDWTNVVNGMLQIATAIGATVATQGAALPFVAGQAINGATQISKPEVERSGGMGGSGGLLSKKSPYIILTRPNQCLPEDQNRFTGYPSLITETLGDLSGYTEIEIEHISGLGAATSAEMLEIQNLLREGVIF